MILTVFSPKIPFFNMKLVTAVEDIQTKIGFTEMETVYMLLTLLQNLNDYTIHGLFYNVFIYSIMHIIYSIYTL